MRRLCVLLLPSLALAPAALRAETIERVVAKVNGQIITLSEFQSRQIAAAQGARVDPAGVSAFLRQNNAKILQDAIDEILILQKAEDAGIHAPPAWIDEAIDGIKKENKITSDEQMQEALAREGLTLAELRGNIERGVLRRIVMQRDVQPKIEASDADVRAEYERVKASEFTKPATVTLQEILIPEDKGGKALATELLGRARAGEDFAALARTYSTAPSRANGGDLGQLAQGELHPDLEKIAFDLAVGTVSDPLPVAGGYRLIRVVAKTTGSTTPFEAVKDRVRDRVMMTRFDKAYDDFVAELRQTAVVELRVREVPLQLTGPIPEGSLREALEPLSSGGGEPAAPAPVAPAAAQPAAAAPASPVAGTTAPAVVDDEVTTTPQAAPERVAPPPRPTTPPTTPAGQPPPSQPPPGR
jgi:peptidyl-prolyl cis-trans isomerase SurA